MLKKTTSALYRCVKASDPISAHVLYRILYWMPRTRDYLDGEKWIASPRSWWVGQTGLTPAQVDRSMSELKRLGLVEIKKSPQPILGLLVCRWVRLTDKGREILLSDSENQTESIEVSPTKKTTNKLIPALEHITKASSKEKVTATGAMTIQEEKESEKEESEEKKKAIGSATQVEAAVPVPKKVISPNEPNSSAMMKAFEQGWIVAVGTVSGTPGPSLTPIQRLKARMFMMQIAEELADPISHVLHQIVMQWPTYRAFLLSMKPDEGVSHQPDVAVVACRYDDTLKYWKEIAAGTPPMAAA